MFEYHGTLVSVYDADTVHLDLDLGCHVWIRGQRYRLARINAPELSTPEGVLARDYLLTLVAVGDILTVRTTRDRSDNYGRLLVELLRPDGASLNQLLLDSGHAVVYPS